MNHHLTPQLLLLFVVIALPMDVLPIDVQAINLANAQTLPVAAAPSVESDPATDADFYLNKADAKIAEIRTFAQSLQGTTDSRQYPFRPVLFSQRDTKQALQTLQLAKTQIDRLPAGTNSDRLNRHRRLLRQAERLSSYLTAIRTSLKASLDPRSFPDLKVDANRFRGLGMMVANIDSFKSDPELAAIIVRQLPAAQQEVDRIATKYDLLVRQETIAGLQLAGLKRYFESKRKSFEAVVKQQRQILPGLIKNHVRRAQDAIDSNTQKRLSSSQRGVVDEKQFNLRSELQKIDAEFSLLNAIDPAAFAAMLSDRNELAELLVAAKKIEPVDIYIGDDRDDLVKALGQIGVNSGLESIRIPFQNWTRRTYWRLYRRQWREIDRSVLEVYVLVKNDDGANPSRSRFLLTKDHLNKDTVTAQRYE